MLIQYNKAATLCRRLWGRLQSLQQPATNNKFRRLIKKILLRHQSKNPAYSARINDKLVPNCVIPSTTDRFDPKATRGSTIRASNKTTLGSFSQLEEIRGPMYEYK